MKQPSKVAEHTHQYEKVEWGKNKTVIWKCQIQNCTHYLHVEFIRGKVCRCYVCGKDFIMTPPKLSRKKPKCDDCQAKMADKMGKGINQRLPLDKPKGKPSTPDLSSVNIDELLENL